MKDKTNKWSWWMILLWAYSTIWLGLILIFGIFFPSNEPVSETSSMLALLSFVPVFVFLIIEGRNHLRI